MSDFMQKLMEEIVYGSVAGLGICVVGHPFDTIKTRKQVLPGNYTQIIKQMIFKEGPFSFYKGLVSPLMSLPAINAVVFSAYSISLNFLLTHKKTKDLPLEVQIIMSSMFSGFLNSFIAGPVELFKTKLQIQKDGKRLYSGNIDLFKKLYGVSGIKGYFQGTYCTIGRDIIGYAAQFYVYYKLTQYFQEIEDKSNPE
jgi:solute carrier family 25 carnitine/acylcarnitine transporter 20/29